MNDTEHPVVSWLTNWGRLMDMNNLGTPEGFKFRSYEAMVLELGQPYTRKPLPDGIKPGKMGECFMNATHVVWDDPERFGYVEGYAQGIILCTFHAWVLDREDGLIFDPTWPDDDQHAHYYGIEFPWEFLNRKLLERKVYGLLANDWEWNNELVRHGAELWTPR